MKLSVIIPSYLGKYAGAAKDRDKKIYRAVDSALKQTYKDTEIIIISDGCLQTVDLIQKRYDDEVRLIYYPVENRVIFGGVPRNIGIQKAEGDFIFYLDIDDYWGENHLKNLAEGIKDNDWIWFNDLEFTNDGFFEKKRDITRLGNCGTSNIAHKNDKSIKWEGSGYKHDWFFIRKLRQNFKKYSFAEGSEYYICHIPYRYDI